MCKILDELRVSVWSFDILHTGVRWYYTQFIDSTRTVIILQNSYFYVPDWKFLRKNDKFDTLRFSWRKLKKMILNAKSLPKNGEALTASCVLLESSENKVSSKIYLSKSLGMYNQKQNVMQLTMYPQCKRFLKMYLDLVLAIFKKMFEYLK